MENVAKSITKEECDAVASVYERILRAMKENKFKGHHYQIWDSLKYYWISREARFEQKFHAPMPNNWSFKQDNSGKKTTQ